MKSANINQAVTGFGMALAAMGASQADAEIVSLSFNGSPATVACTPVSCFKDTVLTASWGGGASGKFIFSLSVSTGPYNVIRVARGTNIDVLAFKNTGDMASGGGLVSTVAVPNAIIGDRYLGFNTTDDLNGWLKVNFAGSSTADYTITFVEGAIQTTPGTAITVGDTGLAPVPVPPMLPAMGLAVLAMGAAGVRRSRKAA